MGGNRSCWLPGENVCVSEVDLVPFSFPFALPLLLLVIAWLSNVEAGECELEEFLSHPFYES